MQKPSLDQLLYSWRVAQALLEAFSETVNDRSLLYTADWEVTSRAYDEAKVVYERNYYAADRVVVEGFHRVTSQMITARHRTGADNYEQVYRGIREEVERGGGE